MSWFRDLFCGTKKRKLSRTDKRLEERIRFLKEKLQDTEVRVIESIGPSELLVKAASIINADFPMYNETIYGTVAGLAEKELSLLYNNPSVNMRTRALAGRALGCKPTEILKLHKSLKKLPYPFNGEFHPQRYENQLKQIVLEGVGKDSRPVTREVKPENVFHWRYELA